MTMAKKDHEVTIVTRNGDTNTQMMTAAEARATEDAPRDESSNIAVATIVPPR